MYTFIFEWLKHFIIYYLIALSNFELKLTIDCDLSDNFHTGNIDHHYTYEKQKG